MMWKLGITGCWILIEECYRIAKKYCCNNPDKDPSGPVARNMSAMAVECAPQWMVFMETGRLCGTAKRSISNATAYLRELSTHPLKGHSKYQII